MHSADTALLDPIVVTRASDAWFASDMHLDDDQPGLTARFLGALRALAQTRADTGPSGASSRPVRPSQPAPPGSAQATGPDNTSPALFLLGDLFEYWIGDDHPSQVAATLADELGGLARRGWRVFLMRGNRDFLLGADYARRCQATLLDEPALVQIEGERIVLAHGDAECLDDTRYQQWRQLSHSPAWQQQFLARSIDERLAMARAARAASLAHRKTHEAQDASTLADGPPADDASLRTTGSLTASARAPSPSPSPSPAPAPGADARVEGGGDLSPVAVTALLERFAARGLIHGHTHRPALHRLGGDHWRWVLSDWETLPPRGDLVSLAAMRALSPQGPLA